MVGVALGAGVALSLVFAVVAGAGEIVGVVDNVEFIHSSSRAV